MSLSLRKHCVIFLALLFGIHSSAEERELYSNRPSISTVAGTPHPELGHSWSNMRRGHVEAVAMLLEMYPDHELYFLARDSELLFDTAALLLGSDPTQSRRIHLLNISRGNVHAPKVQEYLNQEGISQDALKAGRKVMFVDTGFSGTIPKAIMSYYPKELHPNLQTHLICSGNSQYPSTRVFMSSINPATPSIDPAKMHGSIISYEHMPRYTDRSDHFELRNGRVEPLSPTTGAQDGSVDRKLALARMEDLKSYLASEEAQKLFHEKRSIWKSLMRLYQEGDSAKLNRTLENLVARNPKDPYLRSMALDLMDAARTNLGNQIPIEPLGISLGKSQSELSGPTEKEKLIQKFPQWKAILENPDAEIPKLFETDQWSTIGSIWDTVQDLEIRSLILKDIGLRPPTKTGRAFVKAVLNQFQTGVIEQVLAGTNGHQYADIFKQLIDEKWLVEIGNHRNAALNMVKVKLADDPATIQSLTDLILQKQGAPIATPKALYNLAEIIPLTPELHLELISRIGHFELSATYLNSVWDQASKEFKAELKRLLVEHEYSTTAIDALVGRKAANGILQGILKNEISDVEANLIQKYWPHDIHANKALLTRTAKHFPNHDMLQFLAPKLVEAQFAILSLDSIYIRSNSGKPQSTSIYNVAGHLKPEYAVTKGMVAKALRAPNDSVRLGAIAAVSELRLQSDPEIMDLVHETILGGPGHKSRTHALMLAQGSFPPRSQFKSHNAKRLSKIQIQISKSALGLSFDSESSEISMLFDFVEPVDRAALREFVKTSIVDEHRHHVWAVLKDESFQKQMGPEVSAWIDALNHGKMNADQFEQALDQRDKPAPKTPFTLNKELKIGDPIRLPSGRTLKVKAFASHSKGGTVLRAEGLNGKVYALKVARGDKPEARASLGKTPKRFAALKRLSLPHAAVVESGEGYVLNEWIEGVRGDKWVEQWAAGGMQPNSPELKALLKLLNDSSEKGQYVSNLGARDLIWNGSSWVIVDSGSVTQSTKSVAAQRYCMKISKRWSNRQAPCVQTVLMKNLCEGLNVPVTSP